MRSTLPLQAITKKRGTIFETDTVAAISCVPPVRPSLASSVKLKANDGKSWREGQRLLAHTVCVRTAGSRKAETGNRLKINAAFTPFQSSSAQIQAARVLSDHDVYKIRFDLEIARHNTPRCLH